MMKGTLLFAVLFLFQYRGVVGDVAPDTSEPGPYGSFSADYQYESKIREDVLVDRKTDLWGRLYRPTDLGHGSLPVVAIMHGNHATCGRYIINQNTSLDLSCQYTNTGTCPEGQHVVESYLGYDYIGEQLASWGYIVISINANLGITCGEGIPGDESLNMARGRLFLRHLQLLNDWNNGEEATPPSIGVDLTGKIDMGYVGLMGHSRSGEGTRAAVYQYDLPNSIWLELIPGLRIQGILELAGSDGQSRLTFDARDLPWVEIIAGCDGDDIQLRDIHPYDRMIQNFWEKSDKFKGYFVIDGSNHDYLNTEWKFTDTFACHGPEERLFKFTDAASTSMRSVALTAVTAFIRATIGRESNITLNRLFNPMYDLPDSVTSITPVQRSFSSSLNYRDVMELEDYNQPSGIGKFPALVPETMSSSVSVNHSQVFNSHGSFRHDEALTSNLITWESSTDGEVFYQSNWAELGSTGLDLLAYNTLSFRVCQADDEVRNKNDTITDFKFVVVDINDNPIGSPISLSSLVVVKAPVGPISAEVPIMSVRSGKNPTLASVLAPYSWFGQGTQLENVRGLKLIFESGTSGAIWLSNIRVSQEKDIPLSMP